MSRFNTRIALFLVLFLVAQAVASAQWVWTPQTRRLINLGRMPKETPELQVEHARSLMLQGQYDKALNETDKFERFYGASEFADENQFLRGEIMMARGRLKKAAEEFQKVISIFPDSGLFQQVIEKQYEIADQLYERGLERQDDWWRPFRNRSLRRAAEVYSMVIDNAPFTEQAAEAQYKVGLCYFARGKYPEAAFEYRRVIEDYSASEWVDDASYGLIMCYYKGSLDPPYDQVPARLCVAQIDDFRRSFPRDERVEGLDEIRREMLESIAQQRLQTARFYERRRDFRAARIYYDLVKADFPETDAAQAAANWLEQNHEVSEGVR